MEIGTVKWYDSAMKYGFVTSDAGEDCFFHRKDMLSPGFEAVKGQRVLFRVDATSRGLNAREVRLAGFE